MFGCGDALVGLVGAVVGVLGCRLCFGDEFVGCLYFVGEFFDVAGCGCSSVREFGGEVFDVACFGEVGGIGGDLVDLGVESLFGCGDAFVGLVGAVVGVLGCCLCCLLYTSPSPRDRG